MADFDKAKFDEDSYNFAGLEDGNVAHELSDGNVLNPDKFGFQHRLAIFQKHFNDIVQVMVDFVQCFPLGMIAGEAGNKANK